MAERIYPSAKPAAANPSSSTAPNGAASGGAPSFPAPKSQMYNATRPGPYRPQPPKPAPRRRRRSRRGCCCSLFLWLTLLLFALIFLAAIAGGVFYVLYRPHRPTFSVTTLRLSSLNVTSSNQLTSRVDLSVTARNPNRKLVYVYDPVTISVSSNGVGIGDGSFPAFVHEAGNTTLLKTAVTSTGASLDPSAASDLKKKSSLPLEIQLETRAGVRVGGMKTKKIGVRVTCDGINVAVPKGKGASSSPSSSSNATCKVKLRIKIWKWYL